MKKFWTITFLLLNFLQRFYLLNGMCASTTFPCVSFLISRKGKTFTSFCWVLLLRLIDDSTTRAIRDWPSSQFNEWMNLKAVAIIISACKARFRIFYFTRRYSFIFLAVSSMDSGNLKFLSLSTSLLHSSPHSRWKFPVREEDEAKIDAWTRVDLTRRRKMRNHQLFH